MFSMRAPHVALPSLTSLFSSRHPRQMAQGPSFFGPPHNWLGRVALCVICALGFGLPNFSPAFVHEKTGVFFRGCGLAGTPHLEGWSALLLCPACVLRVHVVVLPPFRGGWHFSCCSLTIPGSGILLFL